MTDDEFLAQYARRSATSKAQVRAAFLVLPCACDNHGCMGWAMVNRGDPLQLRSHMELYHPAPQPSITQDDYLAREQRRLKGHRYTWAPLPKEKP